MCKMDDFEFFFGAIDCFPKNNFWLKNHNVNKEIFCPSIYLNKIKSI